MFIVRFDAVTTDHPNPALITSFRRQYLWVWPAVGSPKILRGPDMCISKQVTLNYRPFSFEMI